MSARYEMEKQLIGILLIDPASFVTAAGKLAITDFVDEATRAVFGVMTDLNDSGTAISATAILSELSQKQHASGESWLVRIGGKPFLGECVESANPTDLAYLVEIISKQSRRDVIRNAASRLLASTGDLERSDDELLAEFEQSVTGAITASSTVRTVGEAARVAIAQQREVLQTGVTLGMPSGFDTLDRITGGFRKGQLIFLSGRSFTGKSTLGLNMAMNLSREGFKTVFRCLEMKDFELAERVLCSLGDVRLSQFAQCDFLHDELNLLENRVSELDRLPLWLPDASQESVTTIMAKTRYHKAKHGLDVLFVDHLQEIQREAKHRSDPSPRAHLIETTKRLKTFARTLDIAVVLLTQLKIPDKGKESDEPTEADYSEAKQIMEAADIGMFLHRHKSEDSGKLIVNKVRRGKQDFITLNFNGPHQLFTEKEYADLML